MRGAGCVTLRINWPSFIIHPSTRITRAEGREGLDVSPSQPPMIQVTDPSDLRPEN